MEMNFPTIHGFRLDISDNKSVRLYGNSETPREAFIELLEWLPRDCEISFYDQFFPSPTDPGAYVSVQRENDRFAYLMGNHAWSDKWRLQSKELLAAYPHLNRDAKDPFNGLDFPITIVKARRSAWK